MQKTQHINKVIDVPVGLRRQVVNVPAPQIRQTPCDSAEGAVGIIVSLENETERGLAVAQATDEQQANTQKDVEHKTNEVSAKSAALYQAKADLDSAKRELGLVNEHLDKLKLSLQEQQ